MDLNSTISISWCCSACYSLKRTDRSKQIASSRSCVIPTMNTKYRIEVAKSRQSSPCWLSFRAWSPQRWSNQNEPKKVSHLRTGMLLTTFIFHTAPSHRHSTSSTLTWRTLSCSWACAAPSPNTRSGSWCTSKSTSSSTVKQSDTSTPISCVSRCCQNMPSTSTERVFRVTPPRSLTAGTANAQATIANIMLVKRRKRDQIPKDEPVAEMLSLK